MLLFLISDIHLILLESFVQYIGQFYLEALHYYGGIRSLHTVMVFGINVQVRVYFFKFFLSYTLLSDGFVLYLC